jgi:hypothetical protein
VRGFCKEEKLLARALVLTVKKLRVSTHCFRGISIDKRSAVLAFARRQGGKKYKNEPLR